MPDPRIFLALPSYDGSTRYPIAQTAYTASTIHMKMEDAKASSALTYTFNALWCDALNRRSQGITHFAMLHNDVMPEAQWIDVLLKEMEEHGADVVSAVIPLKASTGVTSTAIDDGSWFPRRITVKEAAQYPKTFGAADVPWAEGKPMLLNTGCWLCKFTDPWIERVCFHVENKVAIDPVDGQWKSAFIGEDWHFSRFAHREDLKIMATTAVKLNHIGQQGFPNYGDWGQASDS